MRRLCGRPTGSGRAAHLGRTHNHSGVIGASYSTDVALVMLRCPHLGVGFDVRVRHLAASNVLPKGTVLSAAVGIAMK